MIILKLIGVWPSGKALLVAAFVGSNPTTPATLI